MEVNETATTVTYKIDDRTGPWVEARKWMDDQVCVCVCVPDSFFFVG